MASEISWRHSATAKTVYATIRSASRQMWNTAGTPALEALTVANWADYDIALTESPPSSYFYVGTWPAGLTAVGWYWLDIYEQVGAGPAIGDTLIGGIIGYWNGTTLSPWDANVAQVGGTAQTAGDIVADIAALPTAAEIDTELSGTHGAGAWGAGSGASTVTYTVTVDGVVAQGVYCRLCTDTAGTVNVAAGSSNSLGQVTFSHDLPSGTTVYIFPSKSGVEFDFDGAGRRYDIEVIP